LRKKFFVTSDINTDDLSCDAPFIFLHFVQQASSSISFSKREGAVLHLFADLYNYHINFSSLFTTFVVPNNNRNFRKARAVLRWSRLKRDRDEAFLLTSPFFNLNFYFIHKFIYTFYTCITFALSPYRYFIFIHLFLSYDQHVRNF
jgi:hypothetical protein